MCIPHMRLESHIAVSFLVISSGLGCQAATVAGPGWGDQPNQPDQPVLPDTPDPGPADDPAPVEDPPDPEQLFLTAVLPLLDDRCNGCHADAARAPVFIDLDYPYTSILESDVIVAGEPDTSPLITWGSHRGPAWSPEEEEIVADWITLEGAVAPGGVDPVGEDPPEETPPPGETPVGDYETSPQGIVDGDNTIALDGVGLPGAELRFFAQHVALGLHMSRITVYGGDDGLLIEHPTFITHDTEGVREPDPEDRFSSLELVVPAAGAAILAENVLLVDFPVDGELSVSFASTSTL